MHCPKCKNVDTKVIDSRLIENGKSIRRRRECERCNHRYTTYEKKEFVKFMVIKSNGNKEIYEKEKLEKSILIACNKRKIDYERIEQMISNLENLWASNKSGVTSKRIGKDVLNALLKLDEVAYIRYASVHLNFETAKDFTEFISKEK
ncbi:MAG: transcriptional regulator NrdR [Candidatus Gracilibacteria bacterium]